jgi:hypothetical protein
LGVQGGVILAAVLAMGAQPSGGPPEIVVSPERILVEPGPVLRATSLIGAPPLPAEGARVTFRCRIGRASRLEACERHGAATAWEEFARRRLRGYVVDVADVRLQPPAQVTGIITITLRSEDRLETAITGEVQPDASKVTLIPPPITRREASFYPPAALRADVSARVALTCRVQPDHALFCPEGELLGLFPPDRVSAAAVADSFIFAAQQMTGRYRAGRTLHDGTPSTGHQFRMTVTFRPGG